MTFSSPIFLFAFLPLVIGCYFLSPAKLKNYILLFFSLLFYAWGEVFYIFILLTSILLNYIFGRIIGATEQRKGSRRFAFASGIIANVGLLGYFKYGNFIAENIEYCFPGIVPDPFLTNNIHLPVGISFFTFQAISYLFDVYRYKTAPQKNLFSLALYISLFPQLIAGPIVRYSDIVSQINKRSSNFSLFYTGIRRFSLGLAKKLLLANVLGEAADVVFNSNPEVYNLPFVWLGIILYALQIYYDFSGYSDMAIGLGRMFGFRFKENFIYPYISKSITEFWRRWHISLSTWFRDYVYIPLGGNRCHTVRVGINLILVFLLTGIWHGASWNFIIWGIYHGFFILLEKIFPKFFAVLPVPLKHIYLLIVAVSAWTFFRIENIGDALVYYRALFDVTNIQTDMVLFAKACTKETVVALFFAVLFAFPVVGAVYKKVIRSKNKIYQYAFEWGEFVMIFLLLYMSIVKVSSSTYNPFIYFRF